MRLKDQLKERAPDSPLWVGSEYATPSGELASLLEDRKVFLDYYLGKTVFLVVNSNTSTLPWLVALDGICKSIVLLPSQQSLDAVSNQVQADEIIHCQGNVDHPLLHGATHDSNTTSLLSQISAGSSHDTRWIISTSGTTGSPKLVSHSLNSLLRSTKTGKNQGAQLRWGLLYDLSRFAGLQVFFQSFCGGSTLLVPPQSCSVETTVQFLLKARCNALSATPSMWRKLLMTPGFQELALQIVSLGGEIADQPLLDALRLNFPAARITHIYASTEAGVGFSVSDGKAGFPASYLQSPPHGIQLCICENGSLLVKPEHNDSEYLSTGLNMADSAGWIDTMDLVRHQGDRVHFLGRVTGAINVGGNKVYPEEVEQLIASVDGVVSVVVTGRKNPILGQLVEARVVAQAGMPKETLQAKIEKVCAEHLEAHKQPAVVSFVDHLDLNPAGKIERTNP